MLTKNIASELGEANIQCNGIGPSYIELPKPPPAGKTAYIGKQP